ncbi:gamma-glutamylcyclotransferase family protein [Thioclava sp. FR2]|uniref:gamma-glutamylcyclotransferase family protein n=1 Tax=Thioclava sp. FR2 TaxID=3445780 RepID=UPI003EBE78D8
MTNPPPRFFGYGSLVNRTTHDYPSAKPAKLDGWRRVWVHVAARPVAYLSVEPDPHSYILGLIADVPGDDWAALDEREHAYARHPVEAHVGPERHAVQVYAVPSQNRLTPSKVNPLLLSYIDVVVQGFLREFGDPGASHFFATTKGWDAPILNDRQKPIYPRCQRLTAEETGVVDRGLAQLGARIILPD